MVEKKEDVIKLLNKNYGTVQDKENKVVELNQKLAKDFSSNTLKIKKELTKELKSQDALNKKINAEHAKKLKGLRDEHKALLEDLVARRKAVEQIYEKELASSQEKHDALIVVINDQIAEIKAANQKLIKEVANQYDKDVKTSEKAKVQIEHDGEKAIAKLVSELKETQEKYESLVVSLNEKNEAQAKKLADTANKKIAKINEEIEAEQLKVDQKLADLVPPFEKKLTEFDELLLKEKHQFQDKESAIRSALTSRVARHEKFLNKAIAQGDNKSVKEHRKNIASLKKDTEKELKLLNKAHAEKISAINKDKNDFVIANKKHIASIKADFVKFKEEKLYQIELCKVTLENDLQLAINTNKLQLETELFKYNEYFAANEQKQAEVVKQEELDLEKTEDQLVTLKIKFDHTNKVNEVKHEEALIVKNNEIAAAIHLLETEKNLASTAKALEQAKLKSEEEIAEKELEQAIKINERNTAIEHHKIDFLKQASVNKEYLLYQTEFAKVIEKRTNATLEYEELEANNRFNLKLAFLEEHRQHALKDFDIISKKINDVFAVEEAMFKAEIEKVAKEDLEQLAEYEKTSSAEIAAMIEKRNALNAKAYKKEIRSLDRQIADKKDDQFDELERRKAAISKKTDVFDKGFEQAKVRKVTALNEATSIINSEQALLDNAVKLLKTELDNELSDINKRYETSLSEATNFASLAEERNTDAIEENTQYQNSRVENEQLIINEIKSYFEDDKATILGQLEQTINTLENEQSAINKAESDYLLEVGKEAERLTKETEDKINELINIQKQKMADQAKFHKDNNAKIESKYNGQLNKIASELKSKTESYKLKTNTIEKATVEANKSFELAKKQVLKIYNMSLEKELAFVNQKLQQDLKNI